MDKMIVLGFVCLLLNGCTTNTANHSKAKSNRTEPTFLNSVGRSVLLSTYNMFNEYRAGDVRTYRCDELTQQQALYLYRNGHRYLDRDNDGVPCER